MLFGKLVNFLGMGFARLECDANGKGWFHSLRPFTR